MTFDNSISVTYLGVSSLEVKSGHIHASVNHLHDVLGVPHTWCKGDDDLGLTCGWVHLFVDVVELDP